MKRYMKFFTGIVFWGILLVCSACTDEYEANNGGMKECCEGVPFTVRAIVADFEELSNAGKSSTRTSVRDEHFKMEFVDGDSIGVFAIKDGAIMDNIDNAKLVYNMSSGSWNPVGNGTLLSLIHI